MQKGNDGLVVIDGNRQIDICSHIGLKNIITELESNEKMATIEYEEIGRIKTLKIPREHYLNAKGLMMYQKYGMDVMPNNAQLIAMYLRDQEITTKKVFTHKELGFDKYEGKEIYKLYNCIGWNSTYNGNLELEPKVSRDAWVDMFNKEVLGYAPLELITIASLSSVTLGFMEEEIGLGTQIIHLYGNSTTGKSTAMKLAISLFGYPDVKKNGLFTTYNATENALIRKISGINGVPIAFDELSMSKVEDFTQTIYRMYTGIEKDRLDKNLNLTETKSWLTTILSNGEKSLIRSAKKNAGVKVRVLELENVKWTKDAGNAERINKNILQNYGHIGVEFAEFVMNKGKDTIVNIYSKWIKTLDKTFKEEGVIDQFTNRRINTFAILLTTVTIFEEMMKIKLNKSKLFKII